MQRYNKDVTSDKPQYWLDKDTIKYVKFVFYHDQAGNTLTASLYFNCGREDKEQKHIIASNKLTLEMSLYQDGILRVIINDAKTDRLRWSQIDDGASIVEDQLDKTIDLKSIANKQNNRIVFKTHGVDDEIYEYEVEYSPFRIVQKVGGVESIVVNQYDTLFYENFESFGQEEYQISW